MTQTIRAASCLATAALCAGLLAASAGVAGAEGAAGAMPTTQLPGVRFVPAPHPDSAAAFTRDAAIQREVARADSAVRSRGGARADRARLLLSWNAPWGRKGAVSAVRPHLADTSGADTLYLCMIPGRGSATFNGFTATLRFHCAAGDTLGAFWRFERTGANAGALAVQFGPQAGGAVPTPWRVQGMGKPAWVSGRESAELKLVYAVPFHQAGPVDSTGTYVLARVFIRHKGTRLAGAAQPVCIEWEEASLAFALRDEPVVRAGERFASWSATPGNACTAMGAAARPSPWAPGKKKSR